MPKNKSKGDSSSSKKRQRPLLRFDHRYICAPMVGASELPFRLLCRRYGTQLAYTPMMSAKGFVEHGDGFQTHQYDRPLVCHFWANTPQDFAAAARKAEPHCDAIDLNLGCPQRTAYLGHFGSYLMDEPDLIEEIVRAAARAVSIPICCKIRLLPTLDETVALCERLKNAGASLIAIHARYRASWERTGPGARDGPAMLDQVQKIRERVPGVVFVANGNTITFEDVEKNLELTKAEGLMSAEGLLDNPALFYRRWKDDERVKVALFDPEAESKRHKYAKKLRKIAKLEERVAQEKKLDADQQHRLDSKDTVLKSYQKLLVQKEVDLSSEPPSSLQMAREYLELATAFPTSMRTIVFHIRRMLKDELTRYQLMKDCLACTSVHQIETTILDTIEQYQKNPDAFVFDQAKAQAEKDALERKRQEEGKRKAYEQRMQRKAKREGKPLDHYLRQGADPPTDELVEKLRRASKEEALAVWKAKHSQHCLAFHLSECPRGRACAFLHMDRANNIHDGDNVAG